MTKKIEISEELMLTMIEHCKDLMQGELPCTFTVPMQDREVFLSSMMKHYSAGETAHVREHWGESEDARFNVDPEDDDIPTI